MALKRDFYKALASGQQQFSLQVQDKRGEVFLKSKEKLIPLAINKTWSLCYAYPKEIKNKIETADRLAEILGLSSDEILEKIRDEERLFVLLKSKLTEEDAKRINNLSLIWILSMTWPLFLMLLWGWL